MADEEEEQYEEATTLGPERWVQFAFVMAAGIVFFIGDRLLAVLYDVAASLGGRYDLFTLPAPNTTLITIAAAVIGAATGYGLYRHPKVKPLADEVASELSKVTWPDRPETWRNTVIVIVMSMIASAYLGIFDAIWSTFTDLIYSTS